MSNLLQAAKQALEALEYAYENGFITGIDGIKTIDKLQTLRQAIAQAEQQRSDSERLEPVGNISLWHNHGYQNHNVEYYGTLPDGLHQLYTAPPQREWVEPSDDVLYTMYSEPCSDREMIEFARAVLKLAKELNT